MSRRKEHALREGVKQKRRFWTKARNIYNLNKSSKLPLTLDCRDCVNIIVNKIMPNELTFMNPLTGEAANVTHPQFDIGGQNYGRLAKFGNTFWILKNDYMQSSGVYIDEFEIGAGCNISHTRTIPLPPLAQWNSSGNPPGSLPLGLSGIGSMCASSQSTLLINNWFDMWEVELPPSGSPPNTPALPIQQQWYLPAAPSSVAEGGLVYIPSSDSTVVISGMGSGNLGNPCCNPMYITHHDSTGLVLGQVQLPNLSTTNNTSFPLLPQLFSFGDRVFMVYMDNQFVPNGITTCSNCTYPHHYELNDVYEFDLTNYTLTPISPPLISMQYGIFMASSPDVNISSPVNLIGNPGFTIPSGWGNAPNWWYLGAWSTTSGQAVCTGAPPFYNQHLVTMSLPVNNTLGITVLNPGTIYKITIDVISSSGELYIWFGNSGGPMSPTNPNFIPLTISGGVASATWTHTASQNAGPSGGTIMFIFNNDPSGVTIDNVSVHDITDPCSTSPISPIAPVAPTIAPEELTSESFDPSNPPIPDNIKRLLLGETPSSRESRDTRY